MSDLDLLGRAFPLTSPVAPPLTFGSSVTFATAAAGSDRNQVQALSQEFESMLLLQVMRQVRQTMTSFGGDDDDQEKGALGGDMSTMNDTIDAELARFMSKSGGFGLSSFLSKSLSNSPLVTGTSPTVGSPALTTPADVLAPALPPAGVSSNSTSQVSAPAAAASALAAVNADSHDGSTASSYPGVVTSAYGWRVDPIRHSPRFHGGVDLRAAYGQEVPAAADGRVVVARPQGDYGLTVVVAHANGYQTRYAHLSSTGVAEGDAVVEGQTIGRAGQSGRATGPHLHLELTRNGQKLDPSTWLQGGGFKKTVAGADSGSSGPSGSDSATGEAEE